jgi:hypothetical protein
LLGESATNPSGCVPSVEASGAALGASPEEPPSFARLLAPRTDEPWLPHPPRTSMTARAAKEGVFEDGGAGTIEE